MSAPDSPEQHRLSMTAQQFQDYPKVRVDDPHARPNAQLEFLKDGKLVFAETKLRAENHLYIADRIKEFRGYRAQVEQDNNMDLQQLVFPNEFIDVLSALCQDSDESFSQLCNRINDLLSPFQRNERYTARFTELIESTVRSISTRSKYGVLPRVLTQLDNGITMIPQYLSFSRREVSDISCLPPDLQAIIQQRRAVRVQFSEHVTTCFESLTPDQQLTLLQSKPQSKPHRKAPAEEVRSPAEIELENEKRRKKEEERRIREEEKRKREEERRKREEEKKLREEERKKREEERRKKEQSQMRLTSLFVKTPDERPSHIAHDDTKNTKSTPNIFPSFYVKEHVSMHPWTIVIDQPSPDFEQQLKSSTAEKNKPCEVSTDLRTRYLRSLKETNPDATQKRGCNRSMNLRSVFLGPNMSEENFNRLQISMKLLQFTEDVRPAYYGTWTKSSKRINARHPLAKDEDLVDYEHDSEGEWEPEGEGEEIQSGDEDEDDPSSDIADPEDAGWLVPEGYLSEGEGVESDEERTTKIASGPTMRPTRKHMAIRPVIIGPIFDDGQAPEDDNLKQYATRMLFDYANEKPYDPFKMDTEEVSNTKLTTSTADENSKKMAFTPEHESELINIIKGKADAMPKLISEAKANWLLRDVSKRQIEMKIKDLAVKEKRGSDTKAAWHVKENQN